MAHTAETPLNLVNFAQMLNLGTRDIEIAVRGIVFKVTENLEDSPGLEQELGRARMVALEGEKILAALKALPDGSDEHKAKEKELEASNERLSGVGSRVLFDRRRIVCRKIGEKVVAWNLVGPSGPVPLDFDALYNVQGLPTALLEEILQAVMNEPIVGE